MRVFVPRLPSVARGAGTLLVLLGAARVALAQQPGQIAAEFVGRPIVSVAMEIEGRPTTVGVLLDLIETRAGEPLSMHDVRETLTHLFSLGRFQGIEVHADAAPNEGVSLQYLLTPLHGVAEIVFRGEPGVSHGELRRVVVERFGSAPPIGRADAAARTLEQHLTRQGFLNAQVTPRMDVRHDPDRTILIFDVRAGARARIRAVRITGAPNAPSLTARLGVKPGDPYNEQRLEQRLDDYMQSLRRRGFYEATADRRTEVSEDRTAVEVTVDVRPGPSVRLAFEGDPLPRNRIEELVPVAREGSVDEDLLEDSDRRIENFLFEQGYSKADASHRRVTSNSVETITFTVRRGPRYVVESVEISGNVSVPIEELRPLVPLRRGEPFVHGRLNAAADAIQELYRRRGFTAAAVEVGLPEVPPADASGTGLVHIRLAIREGVQTRVGSIAVEGNSAFSDEHLRGLMKVAPAIPYYEPAVAADRDAVLLEYVNNGYASTTVAVETLAAPDKTKVDLVFRVREGPRVIVDHVIVVGNTRTSEETIRRELLFEAGKPLGLDDIIESQRRLSALGLFRRVRIAEVAHGEQPRRDIIVTVEEANQTTLAYGGGVELIPKVGLGPNATAVERYDFAPRGSFEIGRRNLWGRNRSVNLFTRISFRPRGESLESPRAGYGFNEYRVVGTYREAGAFNWKADLAMTAFVEQAIRSSFNFQRQVMNAELSRRLSTFVRFTGRYSLGRTRLFESRIPQDEKLDIDRFFPQVRLSSFSASVYRDTRDDPLDPGKGFLIGSDSELAARRIGSQIGFAKTYLQLLAFRTLSRRQPVVLATAVRVGLARGFEQLVQGQSVTADLPASERFFAGGSTTVRGFALDRLGARETIAPTGFAQGGNALLIMNVELRANLWRDLGAVGFMDVGNVFARVSEFDPSELRATPGLGIRYRSPIGPIRFDVGFKIRRRELSPGNLEGRAAYHISVGHAF